MKTLKERVSELQDEIRQRIIAGDFEIIKIEDHQSDGYYNSINISIDGLEFKISVHRSKRFFSQHYGAVEISWNGYEIGDLKHLYEPVEALEMDIKQKQIKKLQDEIRSLQAE